MRRAPITLTAALLAALLVLAGATYAYDSSRKDTIAKGVSVAGIDVGGLDRDEATRRLDTRLLGALRREVRVDHGTLNWRLSAREAQVATDIDASVQQALDTSRDGNFLTRAVRSLTGGKVDKEIQAKVTFSDAAVVRLLDKIRSQVDRKPQDATVKLSGAGIDQVPSKRGLAVDATRLHREINAALVSATADRRFVAQTHKVEPKVTTDELGAKYGTVLIVNRGAFKLSLYKKLKLVKTYGIAVGQVGLETPAGEYSIQNKAVNPAWHVPDSDWAGKLRGKVIPGGTPENPIKARWMGIYDGAGIHGTSARGSIGSAASHGCIRMLIEDVEELYDRVPVGAPVYIA
jgi:lipoprotein-anchoring transpeptidase ErfK/SrfK